ncbi:MAG: hydrogenase [Firmicutes bacterium]|nr:hydrogenase [Bacillota bacterium]
MIVFKELYEKLVQESGRTDLPDLSHLGCLFNPKQHYEEAVKINHTREMRFSVESTSNGQRIVVPRDKPLAANSESVSRMNANRDSVDVLSHIGSSSKRLTYALLAPAFTGQFLDDVTPDKLRPALKALGFDGVVEVALFADILTLKEAIEFNRNIVLDHHFHIASCCCPMWIAMIRKVYSTLVPYMPASVSPMIAGGRLIKQLFPDAITVFIGPCIAKKAEAKEPDIAGAVDYVLTFKEIQDIFDAFGINPADFNGRDKDHSSYAGRIYARRQGVSEAVEATLNRINPDHKIGIRTKHADGVAACKEMINNLLKGGSKANFFEGMGCVGGCIGGPKSCLPAEVSEVKIEEYSRSAHYRTPIDNPYVIELLHRIGIDNEEQLLSSELLIRRF